MVIKTNLYSLHSMYQNGLFSKRIAFALYLSFFLIATILHNRVSNNIKLQYSSFHTKPM